MGRRQSAVPSDRRSRDDSLRGIAEESVAFLHHWLLQCPVEHCLISTFYESLPGFRATFGRGSTCFGLAIEEFAPDPEIRSDPDIQACSKVVNFTRSITEVARFELRFVNQGRLLPRFFFGLIKRTGCTPISKFVALG